MKISKVKIHNFRGIADFEKELASPLTGKPLDMVVFAGPNGSGKTSILEAIVIALCKPKTVQDKAFTKPFNRNGKDYNIEIDLIDGEEAHSIVANKLKEDNTDAQELLSDDKIDYFSSWREPKLIGALDVTLGKSGNRPQDVETNRLWNLKQFLINSYVADRLAGEQTEIELNDNRKHDEILTRLLSALAYFFPGAELDIKIQQVGNSLEDGFDVFLKYPNSDGRYISLDNLSSGEIEVFSFLSSILRKNLNDGILIIDEPELHLHASWHRVIMNALRELLPNTQIICASHSLELIESIMSYELIVLGHDIDYKAAGNQDA